MLARYPSQTLSNFRHWCLACQGAQKGENRYTACLLLSCPYSSPGVFIGSLVKLGFVTFVTPKSPMTLHYCLHTFLRPPGHRSAVDNPRSLRNGVLSGSLHGGVEIGYCIVCPIEILEAVIHLRKKVRSSPICLIHSPARDMGRWHYLEVSSGLWGSGHSDTDPQ